MREAKQEYYYMTQPNEESSETVKGSYTTVYYRENSMYVILKGETSSRTARPQHNTILRDHNYADFVYCYGEPTLESRAGLATVFFVVLPVIALVSVCLTVSPSLHLSLSLF